MAKINFTQDHFAQMQHLLLGMLMSNTTVTTKLGGELKCGGTPPHHKQSILSTLSG